MKNIKILQICAVDFTVKNILLPWIDRLSLEGMDVHVICSEGPDVNNLRSQGYKIKTIEIVRRISLLKNIISIIKIFRYVKKEKFDIVHVHTPIASILGRIAARLAGVPLIIYTAHGFYFHDDMQQWKRKIIINLEKFIGRLCTDLIFTVSYEDMQTAIKEGIISKSRIYHVSNGINLTRFNSNIQFDLTRKRDEFKIISGEKVVGFIGRIVKEKGILDLIHAYKMIFDKLPEVKLLLIGDNRAKDRDTTAKNEILELIAEYGLQDNIIFTGHRTDINELLMTMDVFVLPSYREGLPLSVMEAMAMGKPVVATNIRGCREEVKDGENGYLVPVRNPEKMAQAILKILKDDKLAENMGKNGQMRALQEFDEAKSLQKQIDIIHYWIMNKLHKIEN